MTTTIKKYLDKNGLQYLISKIKGEYHKVTQTSSSTNANYPVLLGGTTTPGGSALGSLYDSELKFNPSTNTLTSPKVYQGTNQVVSSIKMNGATTALTNSNGTVTIPTVAGPTGPVGPTGPTGATGATGATGSAGVLSVNTSGSGNAVTGADLSGGALTLTKGTSFLPLTGGTISGNLNVNNILGNDNSCPDKSGPLLSLGDGLDRGLIFEGEYVDASVVKSDNDESLILSSDKFWFVGNLSDDLPLDGTEVNYNDTTVNVEGTLQANQVNASFVNTSRLTVSGGISDDQLKWNGNFANSVSPMDMSTSQYMNSNRLAFAKAAGITIEYSNNSGSSWTNYDASDGEKQQLVTYKDNVVFRLGKKTSSTTTTADKLRITLNAVSMGVYVEMKKIFIYFSTAGAACRLDIQYQLFTDNSSTWHNHITNYMIGGESGWNTYALDKMFGGHNASETRAHIKNLRLIFYTTSASPRVSPGVYGIAIYGPNSWIAPSNQAKFGTLYSSDYAQHMMLPNGAYPNTTLVGELGNSSHVWSSAYIKTLNVTDKCNATNGFFQTSDARKKDVIGEIDIDKCYKMLDKCQEVLYTLKNDDKEQIGMIAQEVEEFFPEIISTDKEGYKSIDYSKLTVICLRILKDLVKKIEKISI